MGMVIYLNRWKSYFCWLLNLHGVNDVRLAEMPTAEPLVPKPGFVTAEIVI